MVKALTFLKRKLGMSVIEFQEYWRAKHPEVVTRLPGVRRYVQSHVLAAVYAKGEPPHDGIAEVWADDTQALRTMTQHPQYIHVQADEAQFIDRLRMDVIVTDDHAVVDGPVSVESVKALEFFTRRADLGPEAFRRHWRERHAPIAAQIPGLRRYVMSATRLSAYAAGRAPGYDGVAMMWFDSPEALRIAGATPEYRAVVEDRVHFLTAAMPPFILTREHVIV